jgi:ABC-2 type transport system permease protein
MGLVQLSYNSWGLEGAGAQMYFLAPVRIRDIMLGKNLLNFALAAAEVLAMFAVVLYTGNIPSISTIVGSVLWATGTILFSTAVGNQRSLASPKKIILSSPNRKQTSPLSGLISLGVMMVAISAGAGVFLPAIYFHLNWIVVPAFAAYAFGGYFVYNRILGSIDRFALLHRESLFLELCKPD